MEELNKYSGLVVCADCDSVMVPHRAHTMSASYNHFTCRTYRKEGTEVCTAYYIRDQFLDEVVLGRITADQLQTLSGSYIGEMAALREKIPGGGAAIQALREQVCGADHFIDLAKKYTDIRELTPEPLRLFIRKIVVHEKDVKWGKHARPTVEIHYNDIGCVAAQTDEAMDAPESA